MGILNVNSRVEMANKRVDSSFNMATIAGSLRRVVDDDVENVEDMFDRGTIYIQSQISPKIRNFGYGNTTEKMQ